MNLSLAIEHNRAALLRLVVMLFAASGLGPGGKTMLSRGVRSSVLYYLRPMEAALRRLIVTCATGLTVTLRAARAAPSQPIPRSENPQRVPAFPLFDPRMRIGAEARQRTAKGVAISFFDGFDPNRVPVVETRPPSPDAPIDSLRLCRRLQALKAALEDLSKQARRMARAQARCKQAPPGPRRAPPLRPGRPPGHRARGRYEVDTILRECHALALMPPRAPDTS